MRGFFGFVFLVLLGVLLGAFALVGVWRLMSGVSPTAARAWALVATLALPAAGWGCYRLGQTEARGAITGLKMGVSEVHGAAAKAIDLRVTNVRKVKDAMTDNPPVVVLPDPGAGFQMRQLSDGERVDL